MKTVSMLAVTQASLDVVLNVGLGRLGRSSDDIWVIVSKHLSADLEAALAAVLLEGSRLVVRGVVGALALERGVLGPLLGGDVGGSLDKLQS